MSPWDLAFSEFQGCPSNHIWVSLGDSFLFKPQFIELQNEVIGLDGMNSQDIPTYYHYGQIQTTTCIVPIR